MRYLAWFTLGFCGLCTLWAYLPLWSVAAVLGILGLFLLVFWKKNEFRRIFLTVLIGILAGSLWFSIYQLGLRDVQALDGRTVAGTVTFLEDSRATATGQSVRCRLEAEEGRATVRLFLYSGEKLKAGTTYSGRFRLRRDATGNYAGRGEFLTASPVGGLTEGPTAVVPLHTRLRSTILDLLDEVFPSDTAPLARGLLLGDTMDVPDSLNVALKRTGVRHVVAVSGLHVSVLCVLLLVLCGRRKNLAIFLCLPVMLLFVLMAGATPSAIRAAIMASLMLLAGVVHREYDPPTALAFAVLCILLGNPYAVRSLSFQLSVGSVAGIMAFSQRIFRYFRGKYFPKQKFARKCLAYFYGSVSVTMGAGVFSVPLCALYFGEVSLIGFLTNLLGLWAVSFAFYGILLSILLGAIWLPLGKIAAFLTSLLLRYFIALVRGLSAFPLAAVYTRSLPIALWLGFSGMLLAVFLWHRRRPVVYAGACALALAIAIAFSWLTPLGENYRVTVLDVGQGQCVVLQSAGRTYLVDCGGSTGQKSADAAMEYLYSIGIFRIDGMILTHPDADHINGAALLAGRMPIGETYGIADTDVLITQRTEITFADCKITVFPGLTSGTDNEKSLSVLFQPGKRAILITGDRTVAGENALVAAGLPNLDYLVVGHHGSDTSTGETLLSATRPLCAVISVGANNRYGHPDQTVLDRLAAYGCTVLRTDQNGTIIIRG